MGKSCGCDADPASPYSLIPTLCPCACSVHPTWEVGGDLGGAQQLLGLCCERAQVFVGGILPQVILPPKAHSLLIRLPLRHSGDRPRNDWNRSLPSLGLNSVNSFIRASITSRDRAVGEGA